MLEEFCSEKSIYFNLINEDPRDPYSTLMITFDRFGKPVILDLDGHSFRFVLGDD